MAWARGCERRDVITADPSLPTSETRGSLSFFFTRPLKKPRTECGCQPVLAMMSSIVTPECRRSIWITTSCLLCGAVGLFDLAEDAFRPLRGAGAAAFLR